MATPNNVMTPTKAQSYTALGREREHLRATLDRAQTRHQNALRDEYDVYREIVATMDARWQRDNAGTLARLRVLDAALGDG